MCNKCSLGFKENYNQMLTNRIVDVIERAFCEPSVGSAAVLPPKGHFRCGLFSNFSPACRCSVD